MKCPKEPNNPDHVVVENQVFGKRFYYCRGCKDEVVPYTWFGDSASRQAPSVHMNGLYGRMKGDIE